MKHSILYRFLSFLLILPLLFSAFACDRSGGDDEAESTSAEETSTEAESPANTDPAGRVALDVKWNFGYVGSDTNPYGFEQAINDEGSGYSYTDVIELGPKGTKVSFTDPKNGKTSSNAYVVSSWITTPIGWMIDPRLTNIAGGSDLVTEITDEGTVYTYISKYDDEAIRLCYRSEQSSADEVIEHPTVYSELTDETPTADRILSPKEELALWIENDKSRAYYKILEGKKFTVIGDSYLAGSSIGKDYVWATLIAEKYDMIYANYGIGGSTLSNYVTTNHPMVDRYHEMIDNDPDIVIIEGGRNDYNKSVPIGTLNDTSTTTMMGATRYMIEKVRQKFPNALIICLTCWETGGNKNSAGAYCSDYGEAMLEVCEDMGVLCINAMDQEATGVYMTDAYFRSEYCITPNDISHLNADGMKLVMPYFEKTIAEMYEESLKE